MQLNHSSQPQKSDIPAVAIVMCTYNGERFLASQVGSLLVQTYPNIEFVFLDDASTDKTWDLLKEFAATDQRIRLYRNEINLGPNKNFEKAIGLASAQYIAISDQDDLWDLQKIEIMMKEWRPGCDMIFSLSGTMDESGPASRKDAANVYYSDINSLHTLVFNTPVNGHATMFKKEFALSCRPFPADIYYDWWLSMHAASRGTIGCVKKTLSWQRIHGENFSRQLHSIIDKQERDRKKRKQWSYFIRSFFTTGVGKDPEKEDLLYYADILDKMDGKKFSKEMFRYIMSHRKQVFHYKRKPLLFISHFKHARRMAKTGVL
jgi:glycosyltransferase involved in cell wall biosynthesis